MRPPEFTGGNAQDADVGAEAGAASMRPPEFTGGNEERRHLYGTPP